MNWQTSWTNPQPNPAPTPSSNPYDAMNEDQLLMEHKKLQDDLSSLKEKEMELRKYIVNRAFPQKTEGMNTKELGNGYELKATVKFNYKLSDNDVVEKTLQEIAAIGNEGAFVADRLVGWTPTFYKTEYNKLIDDAAAGSETAKKILKLTENMLTITDAAPTLTIKEPKVKK